MFRPQPSTFKNLSSLYLGTFLSGFGWGMILPITPVLAMVFDVSIGAAAQVITAFVAGRLAGTVLGGYFVDQLGTKAGLLVGTGSVTIAAAGGAVAPGYPAILVAMFVIGIGDTVWALSREVAGIDMVRLDQRGRVLSGFHGIHTASFTVGPLLGGILAEAVSFRAVFAVYAGIAFVSIILSLAVPNIRKRSLPGEAKAKSSGTPWLKGLTGVFTGILPLFKEIDPRLRLTYAALVFATVAGFIFRITYQGILPLFASTELGMSAPQIGALFSISGALVFVMILPAGFIIDKIGRKWATVPSTLLPGLAFIAVPFADSFAQLAVLVGIFGISNGLSLGSLATSGYDVVPAHARGRLQAFRRTVAEVGGLGAPLFAGYLANAFNPGVPFLAYAPILLLAGALLMIGARETLAKQEKRER